jgi:hypothetical protein
MIPRQRNSSNNIVDNGTNMNFFISKSTLITGIPDEIEAINNSSSNYKIAKGRSRGRAN